MTILLILLGLITKHFICDYVLQFPFMYENKGKYLHRGGLAHAGFHGLGTFLVLCGFNIRMALWCAVIDTMVHYHVDYFKTNISKRYGPQDKAFWVWHGFDQYLHHATYLVLVLLLTR